MVKDNSKRKKQANTWISGYAVGFISTITVCLFAIIIVYYGSGQNQQTNTYTAKDVSNAIVLCVDKTTQNMYLKCGNAMTAILNKKGKPVKYNKDKKYNYKQIYFFNMYQSEDKREVENYIL